MGDVEYANKKSKTWKNAFKGAGIGAQTDVVAYPDRLTCESEGFVFLRCAIRSHGAYDVGSMHR